MFMVKEFFAVGGRCIPRDIASHSLNIFNAINATLSQNQKWGPISQVAVLEALLKSMKYVMRFATFQKVL